MKRVLNIIVPIGICFILGWIAGYFQSDAVENWYPYLNKPSLTPPSIIFPIAWSILYVCMGTSIGLVLNSNTNRKSFFVTLFAIQLILNFAWSILFFFFKSPLLGAIDIILLEIILIYYTYKVYSVSKISSYLFIPYILWVAFATYLNFYILINN